MIECDSLMMKAASTSETSVDSYFTRQYIPEDKYELITQHVSGTLSPITWRLRTYDLRSLLMMGDNVPETMLNKF
jgi:hypothetical protein